MEEKTIAMIVLIVVAATGACGCALLFKNSTAYAVYEQPANNKPVFIQTSSYIDGFTLCSQYTCTYEYYGEGEPAEFVGYEPLTGNLLCGCPDGKIFQTRPDRIEVETY
ncbi:MAG: hypothetical protein QXF14_03490 [Candidatus Woesearchaeota archaeon]